MGSSLGIYNNILAREKERKKRKKKLRGGRERDGGNGPDERAERRTHAVANTLQLRAKRARGMCPGFNGEVRYRWSSRLELNLYGWTVPHGSSEPGHKQVGI